MRARHFKNACLLVGAFLFLGTCLEAQVDLEQATTVETGGAVAPVTNSGDIETTNVPGNGTSGKTKTSTVVKWEAKSGVTKISGNRKGGETVGVVTPPSSSGGSVRLLRLSLSVSPSILTSASTTAASVVRGTYSDRTQPDLTTDLGTTYTSSNSRRAKVSATGVVTPVANGRVMITARNGGLSARRSLRVELADPGTTLRGRVLLADGRFASLATVRLVGGTLAGITKLSGSFSIPNVPTKNGKVSVSVTASVGGIIYSGISGAKVPSPGSITSMGIIRIDRVRSAVSIHGGSITPCFGNGASQLSVLSAGAATPLSTVSLGQESFYVAVSASGATAVVTGACPQNPQIEFYDLQSTPPTRLASIAAPFANATVEVNSMGYAILSGDPHGLGTVVSVDMGTRTIVSTLTMPGPVDSVALTPDGAFGVAIGIGQDLRVIGISSAGILTDTGVSLAVPRSANPMAACISADGRLLLTANLEGSIDTFRFSGGYLFHRSTADVAAASPTFMVQGVKFNPAGDTGYALLGDPFGLSQREILIFTFDVDGFLEAGVTSISALAPGLSIRGEAFEIVDGGEFILLTGKGQVTVLNAVAGNQVRTIATPGSGRGIAR